jgi:hypothetical protein
LKVAVCPTEKTKSPHATAIIFLLIILASVPASIDRWLLFRRDRNGQAHRERDEGGSYNAFHDQAPFAKGCVTAAMGTRVVALLIDLRRICRAASLGRQGAYSERTLKISILAVAEVAWVMTAAASCFFSRSNAPCGGTKG